MGTIISREAFQRLQHARMRGLKDQPRAKYGNKKVKGFDQDGSVITFDSKREAKRWAELLIRQKAGEIDQLERQISFLFAIDGEHLTYVGSNRKVKYVLDFRYREVETGEWAHEDSKGVRTDGYKLKQALMDWVHGIEVLEV